MKKLIALLLCGAMAGSLAGCKSQTDVTDKTEPTTENTDFSMEVEEDTITSTGATFSVTNNTAYYLEYGSAYTIEKWENDSWETCITDGTEVLCTPTEKSFEMVISWGDMGETLSAGKYQLVKEFERQNSDESFQLTAEFTIE